MRFLKRKPMPEATFDLTAMIDVVLLLIIFFMLTAQFAQSQARPMDLPKERGEATETASPLAIMIDLDREGGLTVLSGEKVTPQQIVSMVRAAQSKEKKGQQPEIIIRADRLAPSRHVNQLAGVLARGGVRSWKLATAGDGA